MQREDGFIDAGELPYKPVALVGDADAGASPADHAVTEHAAPPPAVASLLAEGLAAVQAQYAARPEERPIMVGVAQVHAVPGDVQANLGRIAGLLAAAREARSGCDACKPGGSALVPPCCRPLDILALPETFLPGGYHIGPTALRAGAIPLPTPDEVDAALGSTTALETGPGASPSWPLLAACRLAREAGIALILPIAERARRFDCGTATDAWAEDADGESWLAAATGKPALSRPAVYNSSVLIGKDGRIVNVYRKCHLWTHSGYEGAAFTPGPGLTHPFGPAQVSRPQAADPFHPVTLPGLPHIPIGLLVCFDVEFPEATRTLARRGAKLVVASMASAEVAALTSRKIIPTRAAESHMTVVYANYPSCPPPPPSAGTALAPDALAAVQYAGGTTAAGPNGGLLASLPAYPAAPHLAPRDAPATAQKDASRTFPCLDTRLATELAARGMGGSDEALVVFSFNPCDEVYAGDAARNPYLTAARRDLYEL